MPTPSQVRYALMRSDMHQPLVDFATHRQKCVHKIDT